MTTAPDSPRSRIRALEQVIAAQSAIIEQLQNAAKDQDQETGDGQDDDDMSDGEGLPIAARDAEFVMRCTECGWEVVDGFCHICDLECVEMSDEEDYEADLGIISTTTDNDMLKSERQCAPRGTTPLLEMDQRHARVPDIYLHNSSVGLSVDRSEEYYALRARGATKLMCETFKLEYSPAAGIVAWADQTLFNEFSGPGMKHGDSWKICLGRCLELDEDDIDGSAFIEDLLEDAMLFPLAHSDELGHWETVLDPGLLRTWVTRPKCLPADAAEPHDDEDDSIWKIKRWRDFEIAAAQEENGDEVAVLRNEYDDSDPEDEGMEVDPDWCMAPHGRDAPYAEDNENEDEPEIVVLPDAEVQEEDLRASTETLGEEGDTEDAELGTDSADSDFDSEEELSGDEGLLEHARSISFW